MHPESSRFRLGSSAQSFKHYHVLNSSFLGEQPFLTDDLCLDAARVIERYVKAIFGDTRLSRAMMFILTSSFHIGASHFVLAGIKCDDDMEAHALEVIFY